MVYFQLYISISEITCIWGHGLSCCVDLEHEHLYLQNSGQEVVPFSGEGERGRQSYQLNQRHEVNNISIHRFHIIFEIEQSERANTVIPPLIFLVYIVCTKNLHMLRLPPFTENIGEY